MRPQSEIRLDLAAALLDGPGTCKELAQRTGWSIGLTRRALNNMCHAGDVHKPCSVRVPGVRRPVPVYARTIRIADAIATQHQAPQQVLAAWGRWPDYVR